jgi:hypothetical protein
MIPGARLTGLILVTALALEGCAATKPPSLADEQRERLGRLGVVVAGSAPKTEVAGPTPLGGVGGGVLGALKGAAIGVGSAAGCFVTFGAVVELCVSAIMTPYWIGRGTVEGALNAMPEGERRRAQTAIETAIVAVDPQRLARAIEREALGRARPVVILNSGDRDAPAPDVDTVAEITLLRLVLEEQSSSEHWSKASVPDVNPMFVILGEFRLRVVSSADQRVLLERTYLSRSWRRQFADWARDDAAELHTVRDKLLDELASDVALQLFGARPESPAPPEPAPEAVRERTGDDR